MNYQHVVDGHEECKSDISEVSTLNMDCDEHFPPLKRKRADQEMSNTELSTNPDVYKMMELPKGELPQPYTCICFSEDSDKESSFYTTDQNGFFLHKKKYYRCVTNEDMEIQFKFIRELDLAEIVALQSLDAEDINVIKDLSSNNKSLLY